MLTIVAIALALTVIPSPWGWVTVIVAGLIDVAETTFFVRWSKRRRATVGAETLVGRTAVVVRALTPRGPGQARRGGLGGTRRVRSPAGGRGRDSRRRGAAPGRRAGGLAVRRRPVATLRLTLEYDGTAFKGWARQPGTRTVEGALRKALDAVLPGWDGLAVAGRTDAGVHATGQVASIEANGGPPLGRLAEALNAVLPDDVGVVGAEEAPAGFHARFSATGRSYRYVVLNRRERSPLLARRALWWPRRLDDEALHASAALLVGRARVHGVHADGDAARGLSPVRRARRLGASGRRAPLHGHGRLVPPSHGADARRDDARVEPGANRDAPHGPAARRRGRHRAAVGAVPRARRLRLSGRAAASGKLLRPLATIDACASPWSCSTSTAR